METTVIRVPTVLLPIIRAIIAAYREQESCELATARTNAAEAVAKQFLGEALSNLKEEVAA